MKIAYTTVFDARDVHNWSGTPFYMSSAFESHGVQVEYIGSLKRKLPPFFKVKQFWNHYIHKQRESPRFNIYAAKNYSLQANKLLLQHKVDAIVSPLINPIAYLETKTPIFLWTDALYAGLHGFYPPFSFHSENTISEGNRMTQECLSRCKLAIFSSQWAANTALDFYKLSKNKIRVVPFGANLESFPSATEIEHYLKNRVSSKIKLLFLAKSWERKGGDLVLAVTKALHEAGVAVELTIIGYQPPQLEPIPDYVRCLGYISKNTSQGKEKIRNILADSHFLFVPSRAEAYGIVFCEANAFGVPCLTTDVGGIGTVIQNDINGMKFSLNASIEDYCNYIINTMQNRERYHELALSSYQEYITRLNWKTSVQKVIQLMKQ